MAGQHALASHQQSLLVAPQESDLSSYRTHSSQASQYGSPYAAAYASSTLGTQQVRRLILQSCSRNFVMLGHIIL